LGFVACRLETEDCGLETGDWGLKTADWCIGYIGCIRWFKKNSIFNIQLFGVRYS